MKSSLSDYYLQLYGIVVVRIVLVCVVQFVSAIHIRLCVRFSIRHFAPSRYGRHLIFLTRVSVPSPQTESQGENGDHLSQAQSTEIEIYSMYWVYFYK